MLFSLYSSFCTLLPEAIDKFAAFGEIVRNCSVLDVVGDKHAYLESVIRRERLQSTGIGHQVAIAHGKVAHLDATRIALGISPDGIRFDDSFPDPVRLVFLIASSPTRQSEYLRTLSSLLTMVHDDGLRGKLINMDFDSPMLASFMKCMREQDFQS